MPTLKMGSHEELQPEEGGDDEIIETGEDVEELDEDTEEEKPDGEDADEDASTSKPQDDDEPSDEEETSKKDDEGEEESDESSLEEDEIDKQLREDKDRIMGGARKEYDSLRKEIEDLRKERRELREDGKEQPLVVPKESAISKEALAKELPDVNPDDITVIQKVVEKLGFVKADTLKSELTATSWKGGIKANQDAWLEAHPEYKPENDKDDANWNALQGVLKDHGLTLPGDPKKLGKLLDYAHSIVKPTPISLPKKSRAAIESKRAKVKAAGEGAKGGGTVSPAKTKSVSQVVKDNVEGFTDEEMEEYFG